MAQQFRTTISAVYWTETPEESEAISAAVKADIPEEDQASTLVTIEYKSEGRPEPPQPPEAEPE